MKIVYLKDEIAFKIILLIAYFIFYIIYIKETGFLVFGIVATVCFISSTIVQRYNVYTVEIDDQHISSVSRKNKRCIVDLKKPVYYSVFKTNKNYAYHDRFILVSNEPFENDAYKGKVSHSLRDTYNADKQVLVYYTKKVKKMFPQEGWIEVPNVEGKPRRLEVPWFIELADTIYTCAFLLLVIVFFLAD